MHVSRSDYHSTELGLQQFMAIELQQSIEAKKQVYLGVVVLKYQRLHFLIHSLHCSDDLHAADLAAACVHVSRL